MKHLQIYELYTGTGNVIDYEVGDTVVCIKKAISKWYKGQKSSELEEGKEYKVIKLYQIPEDKYLGNKFLRVDVEDIETGIISKGWESTRFKLDMESDADKYNL